MFIRGEARSTIELLRVNQSNCDVIKAFSLFCSSEKEISFFHSNISVLISFSNMKPRKTGCLCRFTVFEYSFFRIRYTLKYYNRFDLIRFNLIVIARSTSTVLRLRNAVWHQIRKYNSIKAQKQLCNIYTCEK